MAKTKYFVLPSSSGANFTDFDLSYGTVTLSGEQVIFTGSTQVDAVFVRPGVTVDFTFSGSGADKIYLGGNFAGYTASITGSVMTLQRGSGSTLESVSFIKSTSAASSDNLIFADGTLNSLDLYNNLKTGTVLPALSTTETSVSPLAPAAAGSTLNASIKAFALSATGDTFAPAHPGVAMTVVGSVGVDTVYVPRGGVVDCTLLGSGQDLIYFCGNWGDYTKSVSGSVVTFNRTADGYSESVKVVGTGTTSLNDQLVFADGAVHSADAKTALLSNINASISAVTGYDVTMTTPGLVPKVNASALNGAASLEVGSNLVLNYSESVTAVAGKYIHIVNDGGTGFHGESTVNTLNLLVTDSSQVTIAGGRVTLNPTADLDLSNNYHITIDAGAFTGVTSHQVTAAYDGSSTLHFVTVTPGTTVLANAVASQVMNTDGTLGNGHLWLDIEGIGSASNTSGTALDLSANNYALVAKDYDPAGGSAGYDGVTTGDFYVTANNFGAGDLLYIDNQGGAANDLTQTNIINYGTPPTTVQFAGTGLGSLVDISLAGTVTTFDTVAQMKSLLGASNDVIFSDAGVTPLQAPPTATATITGAQDNVAGITGNIASGGLSNDATPTLSGAIVGTMVSSEVLAIYDGATKLGLATVTGSSWSYTPAALGAGAHSFTAVAESALGNQGTTSAAYSLNLDLTSPAAPVISAVATDNIINAAEQTAAISGTAEANATVALSVGGNTRTVTADGSGNWSYTLIAADITAMGQGSETLSATATDEAGNAGAAGTRAISVDTAAPTLITAVVDSGTLTLTFSEAIDGVNLPAAFPVVLVNGVADLVTDASISGSAVILTLTSAVQYNDVVTVSYTDPSSANDALALQDLAGNDGASASALAVTNTTQLAPTFSASALNAVNNLEVGSNLVLNYSESVTAVAGKYIHIVNDGGTGFHGESTVNTLNILVTDSTQVTIVGGRVTLNPTADLDLANNYHITIDAGAFAGVTSHQSTAAYDGSTLHFSTVTPGVTALANAVASQVMNTDGTLGNGHLWLDIENIGSASNPSGTALDLSANNYALVAKDYDDAGPNLVSGYDGITMGNFYVAANNFGAGDLLYVDNQSNNANDLAQTAFVNPGIQPMTIQFAGTGLGGFVDVTLAAPNAAATFESVLALQTLLNTSAAPVISA